jgi:DNA helicase-2/ATP-dependent DNA helicase PcrA
MIDYAKELNPAQLEAATTLEGPVLVVAGAGSGKTRTIVYRLARLVESGVPAGSILLLTFTRKAARVMLERAKNLLGLRGLDAPAGALHALSAVQGGTFHAYAYSVLRLFRPEGFARDATVMDAADALSALQHCREDLSLGKGDHSFPKTATIQSYISKSRNREQQLTDILGREAHHLLPHAEDMLRMAGAYERFKRAQSLLDYDDLLFELEKLWRSRPEALSYCRSRNRYIMVDEYQDTNLVQARLAALLAGAEPGAAGSGSGSGNILAVGDDAQSIYAFRGASVRNILRFPDIFPGTRIIRLEENYRSTQPVLDLANAILEKAPEHFDKHLFTRLEGGEKPRLIRPLSDLSQAGLAAGRIAELARLYPPREIAVLFRAGYQSYHLEVQLNKLGVKFRKYGGIRYAEAAHVKDAMSFARLVQNPLDFTAFRRMAELSPGIGGKTCLKLYRAVLTADAPTLDKAARRFPSFGQDLAFVDDLRARKPLPEALLGEVLRHYAPRLEERYPDDHPRRMEGLEQLAQIAADYADLDLFIADLSLDDPISEEEERDALTLSTIHSAKGLEWQAVLLLDLVEDRFPSRHAITRPDSFEEERRLMYVACTRAKRHLALFSPAALYDRGSGGVMPAMPSPFVRELPPALYEEWKESFTGMLVRQQDAPAHDSGLVLAAPGRGQERPSGLCPVPFAGQAEAPEQSAAEAARTGPTKLGHCTHRIFGRGKIVQELPPDKYRVHFPGMGLKVIMAAYLILEES